MFFLNEIAAAWAPQRRCIQRHGSTRRVVFLDDRLVVLEDVHLGEIVMARDLGETRDQCLWVVAGFVYRVPKLTVSLTFGTARAIPKLVTLDQSVGVWFKAGLNGSSRRNSRSRFAVGAWGTYRYLRYGPI
jgi:hypothetical protein